MEETSQGRPSTAASTLLMLLTVLVVCGPPVLLMATIAAGLGADSCVDLTRGCPAARWVAIMQAVPWVGWFAAVGLSALGLLRRRRRGRGSLSLAEAWLLTLLVALCGGPAYAFASLAVHILGSWLRPALRVILLNLSLFGWLAGLALCGIGWLLRWRAGAGWRAMRMGWALWVGSVVLTYAIAVGVVAGPFR